VTHRAGQDLAGVDAHAQSELRVIRKAPVHLLHRGLHPERGAHRALLVVLVGQRCTEHRHHVVADVLVHRSAEALHLRAQPMQRVPAIQRRYPRPSACAGVRRGPRTRTVVGRHSVYDAGMPITVVPSGTSRVTTAPAPTTACLPTSTPGRTIAPAPMCVSLPT